MIKEDGTRWPLLLDPPNVLDLTKYHLERYGKLVDIDMKNEVLSFTRDRAFTIDRENY